MDIFINRKAGEPAEPQDLSELANWLKADLGKEIEKRTVPGGTGEKDGLLLTGLAVLGAAFTAINTTINVLNYWASKHKRNKMVTLSNRDVQIVLGDLSDSEITSMTTELQAETSIEFLISSAKQH